LFTGYTYNKPPFDYVEISLDGENFELIGSFPAGSDVDYTPEATVVGRYLRLRWDAKTTYTSYYITELEAFGTKFEGTIHPYPKFELPEASRLIDVNAKGTIEFTYEMGDDFEDDNFGVSASSSDENVVKIEDVVLDRANHKVIVSLASFENPGNAEITVSMTNGLFVRNKKETVTVWYSDYPDVLAGKAATSFVENGTPKEDVDLSLFTDGDFSTGYNGYNVNDEITFDMGSNYQAKKLIWYEVTPQKVEFSTDGNEWLECEEFAGLSGVNELILKAPFVFRYIRFTVGATWAYFNANEFQVYAKAYDGIVHTHPRFTLENKYLVKNGDETKISFKYTMDDEEYAENFAFTAKSLNEELFTVTNVEHRKLEKKINITVKAEDVFAKGMISVKAVNGEYTCERETAVEIWDTSFPNIVSQKPCSLTANVTYFNPEPECKVITDGNLETYTDGQNWVFSTYYLYTTFELDGIYDIRKIAWTGSLNHLFEIETSYDGEEFTRFEGFDESTLTASDDNYIFGDNFPKAKFIRLSWSNWEQYGSFKINELEIYGKLHEGVVNWHPIFKLPYKFNANAGKENVLVYSFDMGEEEYTDTFSASATTDSELFAVKGVEVDKENHKAYITIEAGEEHGSAPISVTMTNGDFSKTRLGLVEIFNTDVQNILLGLGGAETDGDFTTKPEESVGTKVYDMTTYFDISRISWAGSLIGMAVSENGS
ncbi:MAG: hypothetical protein HUJ98_10285, partial [Bacteroidaceae bacterium]|nr:hypothetical protein [Bacteroidaceae bacterium]